MAARLWLPNPPGCISAELIAALVFELVKPLHQADISSWMRSRTEARGWYTSSQCLRPGEGWLRSARFRQLGPKCPVLYPAKYWRKDRESIFASISSLTILATGFHRTVEETMDPGFRDIAARCETPSSFQGLGLDNALEFAHVFSSHARRTIFKSPFGLVDCKK